MTEEKKGCCCGEEKEEVGSCCGGNHEKGSCCGEHGHDHGHDHNHDEEVPVLHLELEDGTEMPCYVLEILDIEDASYIALLPEGEETFMIYQYEEEGEDVKLSNIESDDEYVRIATIFEAHFDEEVEEETKEEE